MTRPLRLTWLTAICLVVAIPVDAVAQTLRVGVVHTVVENTLEKNLSKVLHFIERANRENCQLVVFCENALCHAGSSIDKPTKSDIDAAIDTIGRRAGEAGIFVVFGLSYKRTDDGAYRNRGVVYDSEGRRRLFYWKNSEVPRAFDVNGVACNLVICSDRWYLEHSDLPCLVQDSKVIIDISGGHGGDEGRPVMRYVRYRPWAYRTNAFVLVSNPVHDDTDYMGFSPWGGGSAVIRPDGTIQASRTHEKDDMIVEDLDMTLATRVEADRRRSHPLFRSFWNQGRRLLMDGVAGTAPDVKPLQSASRNIRIAAAQMACSRSLSENTKRIVGYIREAAMADADVVVFPELAVTGNRDEDILAADSSKLDAALAAIRKAAAGEGIYVIVGMPHLDSGIRRNGAVVIDDRGEIQTIYAQIAGRRKDLFQSGDRLSDMWFTIRGVQAIVTVGDDVDWIEIADLAASRGMYLHFHISYADDASSDTATLRKQRNLVGLMYAGFGAAVNAADPSKLSNPSAPAGGLSMIVSREGGHNQPAPDGVEYYLPYHTSIIKGADTAEAMIFAERRTQTTNNKDLDHKWQNRNRQRRPEGGWHEWIRSGMRLHGPLPSK